MAPALAQLQGPTSSYSLTLPACLLRRRFLYDIVANKRNSIDVDKFDYLARDSFFCGVKISFDHERPYHYSKVRTLALKSSGSRYAAASDLRR